MRYYPHFERYYRHKNADTTAQITKNAHFKKFHKKLPSVKGKFSLRLYQIGQTYAKDEYQHYYVTIHPQTVDIHSQNAAIHSQNANNVHF